MRDPMAELAAEKASLLQEARALGLTISAAKAEIAALKVDDITASHIPSATDELDAIVVHTATATNEILEVCETLDGLAAAQPDCAGAQLRDSTRRIYEACSFQDITGQRISKVVAALKAIEVKVAEIITAFGGPGEISVPVVELLNGPQLPASAMAQHDIDKLLASFE
jgi:chemotaxis protein CheZ